MGLKRTEPDQRQQELLDALAELRAEVKALRAERDNVATVTALREDIERLKREKATLTEAKDREIRETEHKTGLLRARLEQDRKAAEDQARIAADRARLEVREENLAADKQRFADEVAFQREHLQGEVTRIDGILRAILERLPNVEAALNASFSNGRAGANGS